MTWDFTELNPLFQATGSFSNGFIWVAEAVENLGTRSTGSSQDGRREYPEAVSHANLADATTQVISMSKVVSTDPPYFDNIGYADLSDFFYVWLRRTLKKVFPSLFATMAVPKSEELVATPYRHGGKDAAEQFFIEGMTQALHRMAEQAHPGFPVSIYYAFKQSECGFRLKWPPYSDPSGPPVPTQAALLFRRKWPTCSGDVALSFRQMRPTPWPEGKLTLDNPSFRLSIAPALFPEHEEARWQHRGCPCGRSRRYFG
jgi:putative DNA methylase